MKGVAWGPLYNSFGKEKLDTAKLEAEISRLMRDEDVTKKSGIYDYVLSGSERALSIRAFTDNMKREAFERQRGICPACNDPFPLDGMEADHITPWSKGGKTVAANCQMLCKLDNRKKSGKLSAHGARRACATPMAPTRCDWARSTFRNWWSEKRGCSIPQTQRQKDGHT